MNQKFVFALFIAFLLMPSGSLARDFQVGVSPNRMDVGEVPAGSEKYASFSLVTQSPDEIVVRLDAITTGFDILNKAENSNIRNIYSEEDASTWLDFPANPIVILPANRTLETLGGSISGWRGAGFNIRVPKGAEPCYHSFQIKPSPYTSKTYDTGVNIAAVTVVTVFFRVPGNCIRDGTILDIRQGETRDGKIAIDTYFKNTGSATISATASDIKIQSENGTEIAASDSGTVFVKPGQITVFRAYFDAGIIETGKTYGVTSTVSYNTGNATKSTSLIIEYSGNIEKFSAAKTDWNAYLPNLTAILVIIILILSYLIYKRE